MGRESLTRDCGGVGWVVQGEGKDLNSGHKKHFKKFESLAKTRQKESIQWRLVNVIYKWQWGCSFRLLYFNNKSSVPLFYFSGPNARHANGFTIFVSSLQVHKCFDGSAPGDEEPNDSRANFVAPKKWKEKTFRKKTFCCCHLLMNVMNNKQQLF